MKISIHFPSEDCTVSGIEVSQIADNRIRLNEAPMLIESVGIFDLIEVEPIDDTTVKFVKVCEPANWTVYTWAIPQNIAESQKLTDSLLRIEKRGGHWDRVFGGLLNVYISPDSAYDPTAEIEKAISDSIDA